MIADVIREWSDRPFKYGESDCCQFAGAVVEALTGENPMSGFDYADEAGAEAAIGGDLEERVREVLGEPISVSEAQDGDILMIDMDGKKLVAVMLCGQAVYKTSTGITDWPIDVAYMAWGVKCRTL